MNEARRAELGWFKLPDGLPIEGAARADGGDQIAEKCREAQAEQAARGADVEVPAPEMIAAAAPVEAAAVAVAVAAAAGTAPTVSSTTGALANGSCFVTVFGADAGVATE